MSVCVCVSAGVGLGGVRQGKEVKVLKVAAPGTPPLLCDQHYLTSLEPQSLIITVRTLMATTGLWQRRWAFYVYYLKATYQGRKVHQRFLLKIVFFINKKKDHGTLRIAFLCYQSGVLSGCSAHGNFL